MRYSSKVVLALVMGLVIVGATVPYVAASPIPNSAVIKERIFNDCPSSILTTTNNYPASIVIDDQNLSCGGFANLHNWRFSTDGVNAVDFANEDGFSFSADLVVSGSGGEAGLSVAPWWSLDVDGRFNVRSTDGEVACFGGRLPFYSFTSSNGVVYVAGTTITLTITYRPHRLAQYDPATIEYVVDYMGNSYTSGELPFDQGNPAEDPPHGVWGMLSPSHVGGYVQAFLQGGNPMAGVTATWGDITYTDFGTVAAGDSSWGKIKSLFSQ